MKPLGRIRRDEDAQALVEFSLVLPVVLLLLLGILQVGLVLNARQTIENAARIAADTYARTLSASEADVEAARAAGELSPRLAPPVAATAYTVIGQRQLQTCLRLTGLMCRQVVTSSVRTDRPASAADPGTAGELVRATIRYDYPIAVGGLARFGFPTHVPLTGEAISLIDAQPSAARSPRTICYEVSTAFPAISGLSLYVMINGSPSARLRAVPGTDQTLDIVARPGQAFRQGVASAGLTLTPPEQTPVHRTVRVGETSQTISADGLVTWQILQGGRLIGSSSQYFLAVVTLRPAADRSCAGSPGR